MRHSVSRLHISLAAAMLATSAATLCAQEKITYNDHVLPIFRNACLNCHNPDKKRGARSAGVWIHDLAYSKLAARREKDIAFVANLLRHNLVRPSLIERLIAAADEALRAKLAEAWTICRAHAAAEKGAG